MARAIVSRLLHEPTLRLKRAAGDDDAYLYVNALRELFGLDAEHARRRPSADASVTPLRPQGSRVAPERCGGAAPRDPGQRAGARPGAGRSPSCSAAPSWSRSTSDGEPGDKSRFVAGSSGRCSTARPTSASTPRRTCRPSCRTGLAIAGGAGARGRRATPGSARRLARRGARGRAGRAPRACAAARSCSPPRPDLAVDELHGNVDTRLRTPRRRASSTRSCSPPPACGGSAARARSRFPFDGAADDARRRPGHAGAPGPRRRRGRTRRGGRGSATPSALAELTAERAVVARSTRAATRRSASTRASTATSCTDRRLRRPARRQRVDPRPGRRATPPTPARARRRAGERLLAAGAAELLRAGGGSSR